MRQILRTFWLSLAITAGVSAQTTIHVNPICGDDAWTGLSDACAAPDGPKRTIRAALEVVESGGTVLLADGEYAGEGNYDLEVLTDDITIASVGGPNVCVIRIPSEAEYTIKASMPVVNSFTLDGIGFHGIDGFLAIALRLDGASSTAMLNAVIHNCTFLDCGAAQDWEGGSVLFAEFVDLIVEDTLFLANTDGPLHIENSNVQMRRCEYFYNGSGDASTLFLDCEVLIEDSSFVGNATSCLAGALYLTRCTTTILRSNFDDNFAGSCGAGSGGYAGALHIWEGSCIIEASRFDDNTAASGSAQSGYGGAIYAYDVSELRLISTGVTRNYAEVFGGISFSGTLLSIVDCYVAENRSEIGAGGGVSANVIEIRDSVFDSNIARTNLYADAGGGAMSLAASDSLRIENTLFIDNEGLGYEEGGGAALRIGTVGDGLISNCTFVGGIVNPEPECYGPALYLTSDCNLTLANCVIWDNEHPLEGMGAIALQENASLTVAYSLLENGADSIDLLDPTTSLTWLDGNLDLDPRFVDREAGDLRLQPNSPAIDAGDNSSLPPDAETDLDGLPRYHNDLGTPDTGAPTPDLPFVTDMGCYEFQGTSFGVAGAWPAQAGRTNIIAVVGAEPGEAVHLFAAATGGATVIPQCPEIILDLASPTYLGSRLANASGQTRFLVDAPGWAAGHAVRFQALAYPACEASNLRIVPFN